jgi:hypothetical protein
MGLSPKHPVSQDASQKNLPFESPRFGRQHRAADGLLWHMAIFVARK